MKINEFEGFSSQNQQKPMKFMVLVAEPLDKPVVFYGFPSKSSKIHGFS